MKEKQPTDRAKNAFLARAVIALAVAMVAMKIHAEVTINYASAQNSVNIQSDGSPLNDSFTFELGTFSNGFSPSSSNTDDWLANWTPVQDSGGSPLSGSSTQYGTLSAGIFGSYEGYASSVTLDHNNTPFSAGAQGYVWGYNSQTGDAEWVLMTNDTTWTFPSAAGVAPSESWTIGTANNAIVGNINFTDAETGAIAIQTASIVPEPSTGALILSSIALLALRRRGARRRAPN